MYILFYFEFIQIQVKPIVILQIKIFTTQNEPITILLDYGIRMWSCWSCWQRKQHSLEVDDISIHFGDSQIDFCVDINVLTDFRWDHFTVYGSNTSLDPTTANDKVVCISLNEAFSLSSFTCDQPVTARWVFSHDNMSKHLKKLKCLHQKSFPW